MHLIPSQYRVYGAEWHWYNVDNTVLEYGYRFAVVLGGLAQATAMQLIDRKQ